MKIPTIRCGWLMGDYHYFLPNPGEKHVGAWLKLDEFVSQFLARCQTQGVHCADPKCNQPFNPERENQLYCSAVCRNRFNARQNYRLNNGLPAQTPRVNQLDLSALEADLRQACAVALKIAEATPKYVPLRTGGTDDAPVFMMKEQQEKYYPNAGKPHQNPLVRFERALKAVGFTRDDFWSEGYNELYAVWETAGETLPDRDGILADYVAAEKYGERLADEAAKAQREADAKARCAQLYPNMDRVASDGSLKPE